MYNVLDQVGHGLVGPRARTRQPALFSRLGVSQRVAREVCVGIVQPVQSAIGDSVGTSIHDHIRGLLMRSPAPVDGAQTRVQEISEWLTVRDACAYAKCSRQTIWRWQKEGLASGRGGRVRRHDLDLWLAGAMGNDSNSSRSTELLKLEQAAVRANVSRQTIWRWSNNGLKIQRRGRVVRIQADVLDDYLKDRTD